MKKNDTYKDTAAAMLSGLEVKPEPEPTPEPPKPRRRRSLIDREPLPGDPATPEPPKKKRTRRHKPKELLKSRNITVVMTEQLYQRLKKTAETQELSMNGIINRLIRKYVLLHDIDNEDLGI